MSYCDKLIFSTSSFGEGVKSIISFDCCKLKKMMIPGEFEDYNLNRVLEEITDIFFEPEKKEEHYFIVEMENVSKTSELLDLANIKSYVSQVAPVAYDQKVFFHSSELHKHFEKHGYNISHLEPEMIAQFSNFNKGVFELVDLLSTTDNPLTFDRIGLELLGERRDLAMKKYGENHAKLAEIFDLVRLSETRPITVEITNFGKLFSSLDKRFTWKLLRVLALRDPMIKNLICNAKNGFASFSNEANCLSETTIKRRSSNVKYLLEMVLKNTEFEYLLGNVIWN